MAIQESLLVGSSDLAADLSAASDVVISGCSAGGLATFLHCDQWADRIHELNPAATVKCMPDSGLFVDIQDDAATADGLASYENPGFHDAMRWVFETMEAVVDESCVDEYTTDEQFLCFFAENMAPHLSTPLFALQSRFDGWSVLGSAPSDRSWMHNSGGILATRNESLINEWGEKITLLVDRFVLGSHVGHGAFLSSCSYHCGMWSEIQIGADSPASAFASWFVGSEANMEEEGDPHVQSANAYFRLGGEGWMWDQAMPFPCPTCCGLVKQQIQQNWATAIEHGAAAGRAPPPPPVRVEDVVELKRQLKAELQAELVQQPASGDGVSVAGCICIALLVAAASNAALFMLLVKAGYLQRKEGGVMGMELGTFSVPGITHAFGDSQ